MTFKQSVRSVFSNYATFSGRASRSEYWYFALFMFIIYAVLSLFSIGGYNSDGTPPLWYTYFSGILGLAVLLPCLAVTVRRLHDIGKGGGWIFIACIPVIGSIWLLILTLLAGQPGDNRFGPPAR